MKLRSARRSNSALTREADLDLLAAVNTFVHRRRHESRAHNDHRHTRQGFHAAVAKKFPKTLLGLPWKIDYRIRVPLATDLEINAGRGPITISGVEGNIRLSAAESDAKLQLSGGTFSATIGLGKVNLNVPVRSWRGVGAEIRLAAGEITLELPAGFNGDLNAEILRAGQITDSYGAWRRARSPG